MQSFIGENLPRLESISFIVKIKRDKKTKKALNELFNIRWGDNRIENYFFLTPKTSKVRIVLSEFLNEFGEHIKEKELVGEGIRRFILTLQRYELLSKGYKNLMKLEDKRLEEKDILHPIHRHDNSTDEIIFLDKEQIKNYSFFQIVSAQEHEKVIPLGEALKKINKQKEIKITKLNYELTKSITQVCLIEKEGGFYIPSLKELIKLQEIICTATILICSLFKIKIDASEILEKKFREF